MAPAQPSFLQAYQPPAGEDVLPRLSSSDSSARPADSSSRGGSTSSAKSSQKPSSSRRKKRWNNSSSGVDGLVFYTLGLAAALGTGAYFAWKRWQQHQKAKSQKTHAVASSSGQDNGASSRSPFTFDKPSHNKKNNNGKRGQACSAAVIKQPPIPPVANLQQQPLRAGNPKKDKALRKERKEMKQARKQAVREQQEQVHVAAARAAESVGQTQEDPSRVTYIDYDKTADAFQRVKDWQETGKKKFN